MKVNQSPQLILFDGATGAGKSTLLEHLRQEYSGSVFVGGKLTTRKKRIGDNDWEFQFVEGIPDQYSRYAFNSVGNQYAIDHKELMQVVGSGLIYVITCVDQRIMEMLMADYDTTVIYVYRSWRPEDLEALLTSRGVSDRSDSQLRRNEVTSVASQYLEKITLYDYVLLNVGSKNDLIEQLSQILLSYGISPTSGTGGTGGNL